ncbi:MAG: hypothetical protein GY760_00585 [Deltaproteobacteria bacterium]|nr:hypothetical protein [Deltaproteobacteria bacterium]
MSVFFFTESPPFRQRLFHTPGQFFHSNTTNSIKKAHLGTVTSAVSVCKSATVSNAFYLNLE